MATVVTSIGSNSSIDTETPSSCSGSYISYDVTFSTDPTGVSVGDRVEISDESMFWGTFVYRVTAISGSTYTLAYISDDAGAGDTSPCDLQDSSYSQAPATFKRFYSSITNWEAGLDDSEVYSSSDIAVGECHNDSVFSEYVAINGGGTVGLASVTLSVHSGSRHDGTAGTGARIVPTSTPSGVGIVNIYRDDVTVEWLEISGASATSNGNVGVRITSDADSNIFIRNNIIHDMNDASTVSIGIYDAGGGGTSRYVMNNFIYNVNRSAGDSFGIYAYTSSGFGIYCNTVFNVTSDTDDASGIYVRNSTSGIAKDNICLGVTGGGTGSCFEIGTGSANAASDYNLSDDATAWGSNSVTSSDGATAANTIEDTTSGSEDLHLKSGSYAIGAGVDLGTTPTGVEIDIDGRNRDTEGDTWDIGADQTLTTGVTITPSAAAFELAGISPTIPSSGVTVSPAVASFELYVPNPMTRNPSGITVVTSIGSNASVDTETPSSCSGAESPYDVTFVTTPTGVSVGDMVEIVDEDLFYATFTYRVTAIAGTSFTIAYITDDGANGDTSPCDLYDSESEQASATFKRFYTTITNWEAGLTDSNVYGSGDDAVGEMHNDSVFDEAVTISITGDTTLHTIKLSVHADSRHDGTAGSGARIVYTGTAATIFSIFENNCTVEWLEIDGTNTTASIPLYIMAIYNTAFANVFVSNNILHGLTSPTSPVSAVALGDVTSAVSTLRRYVQNNFIYDIHSTQTAVVRCVGIYDLSTGAGSQFLNNTIFDVTSSTTSGSASVVAGIYTLSSTTLAKNNIAIGITAGSAASEYCFVVKPTATLNPASDYNLSDDTTAWGSNSVTSSDGATAANTITATTGTIDLHLKSGSYAIEAGVDLGTTPTGVEIDIDGRNRDTEGDTWDIGADQKPRNIEITPAVAAFELAGVSPSVTNGSLSITVAVAAFVLAGITPTTLNGSISLLPAAATFELAAVSPSVTARLQVTPAAASFELAGVSPTAVAGSLSLTTSVAAVEFAGVSPSVQLSSISLTPSASAFELAAISPTIYQPSITPAAAVVEFAGISPSVLLSSLSVTPSASAFEFAAVDPSVGLSSLTVAPGASAIEFAGVSPSVVISSQTITPAVAAFELAGISPTVTLGGVSVTPAAAITNYRARYGAVIFGGIVVIPVTEAEFAYTAVDPAVGMSSQTVAVAASAFELAGVTPSTINGSITVSPAVSVVEFAASVATIHAGVEVSPAVAEFEYVVGVFTLHVTMDSASLGYDCDGLVDYRVSIPCDYEIIGVLDYIAGVLPTDYQLEKNLDYRYDHQS